MENVGKNSQKYNFAIECTNSLKSLINDFFPSKYLSLSILWNTCQKEFIPINLYIFFDVLICSITCHETKHISGQSSNLNYYKPLMKVLLTRNMMKIILLYFPWNRYMIVIFCMAFKVF